MPQIQYNDRQTFPPNALKFKIMSNLIRAICTQTVKTLIRHPATSDLGLHCLPMSHKKDARLIWVKSGGFKISPLLKSERSRHI